MKKVTISLVLLGALTLGLAADATIDEQIEEIQTAPAQERVQLMNQFKEKLATMNSEDRSEAISKLRARAQTRTQDATAQVEDATAQTEDATKTMTQTRTRTQTRAQDMQLDNAQEMNRAQNMNQHQMQNQVMDSVPVPTTPTISR